MTCVHIFTAALFSPVTAVGGATVLGSQLPRSTAEETSCDSPALKRKASQRITAAEGSLILEKYVKKPGSQEEDPSAEGKRGDMGVTCGLLTPRLGSVDSRCKHCVVGVGRYVWFIVAHTQATLEV